MTYAAVALAIALVFLLAGYFWGRSNVRAQVEQAVEKEQVALDMREFTMRQQLEEAIAEIARLRPMAEELSQVQKRLKREQAEYARMKGEFNAATRGGAPELSVQEPIQTPEPPQPPDSADLAIQKLLQSLEAFNEPDAKPPLIEKNENTGTGVPIVNAAVPTAVKPTPPTPPIQVAETPRPAGLPPVPTPPPPSQPIAATARPEPAREPQPVSKPQPVREPQPLSRPQPAKAAQTTPPEPRKTIPPEPRKPIPAEPRKPAPTEAGKPVDEWQEFARQLDALTGRKK
jgi:hypothetical protein